jgi:hypothetical protein
METGRKTKTKSRWCCVNWYEGHKHLKRVLLGRLAYQFVVFVAGIIFYVLDVGTDLQLAYGYAQEGQVKVGCLVELLVDWLVEWLVGWWRVG